MMMRNFCIFILFLFCLGCQGWNKAEYLEDQELDDNYVINWRVDFETQILHLALVVKTVGWIGFGFGENVSGSMPGSDMLIINIDQFGAPSISDRYAVDFVMPLPDSCQDWKLFSFERDLTTQTTVVELQRKLDTGDNQDRAVVPGMNKVVFAYGLETQLTITYHEARRGSVEVTFYPDPDAPEDPGSEFTHEFHIGDFKVPIAETNYICMAFESPLSDTDPDHHVTRIDPIIDPRGKKYAHHMLIHICDDAGPLSYVQLYLNNPSRCFSPIGNPAAACHSLLFGWAMGGGPIIAPPEAGMRMGHSPNTEDGFRYLVMEMHYDNPDGDSGVLDNSGFRIHYTANLRKYDAASMTLGDPFIQLPNIPPRTEAVPYETTCPSECTSKWPHDIHVFVSSAHMHKIGAMQWTTQYRNEQLIGTTNRVEYFQFDFQQQTTVDFVIKPGDRLNTHCVFNSRDRSRPTGMGMGSSSEMCMDFLNYYPRMKINGRDYAYCGYLARTATFCGPMDFTESVIPVRNPIASDLQDGLNKTFGAPCSK